jgi:hypothetical protein
MSKQTAVEWLLEQISVKNGFIIFSPSNIDRDGLTEIFDQAKAMEMEQIEDAYEIGFADAWDDAKYDDEPKYAGSEQYYNETYGGDK